MSQQRNRFAPGGEQTGKGPALAESPLKNKIKGLLALGLCLCLGLGLLPVPALAAVPETSWTDAGNFDTGWYNGTDTEFTLTTAKELAGLASLVNGGNSFSGKTVRLGANIDLSAHLWTPIGASGNAWEGSLDGGGKTVSGMIVSMTATSGFGTWVGFFSSIATGGSVRSLNINNASVSVNSGATSARAGILAAEVDGGTISDCAVSGSVSAIAGSDSTSSVFAGGMIGRCKDNNIVKNSSARLTSITATTSGSGPNANCYVGGIAGWNERGSNNSVENCFAEVDSATITAPGSTVTAQYKLAPAASYSYWDATNALTDSPTPTYTQCYAVTAEQIAGTGGGAIGQASDTYANTPSLLTALNGWAAANAGHSAWSLKGGAPTLSVFLPTYLDIGVVPEQSKDSAAGTLDADVKLHGQVQENVELLSVTLPAAIPFILDVDNAGALKRVLSGTGTLTNRSDMGVTVTLTSVTDPDDLLTKADLSLVPDPLPAGGNVALSVGTGKTDVLSTLAAQTGGVPATSTLKVDGAAKASVTSVGGDGDTFTVGLTLKVSKT